MAPLSTNTSSESTFSSSSPHSPCHRINKKQGLQQSFRRFTDSLVQADLEAITAKSPFLQRPATQTSACFCRSEILTAQQPLGRGGYSEVYEIVGFCLSQQVSNALSPEQQELRQHYADTAIDHRGGRFVLKQLQEQWLYDDDSRHHVAALDLALEGAYLQRLQHPNIVTLQGLPVASSHGRYFLILDRLSETLDERIEQWSLQQEEAPNQLSNKKTHAMQLASALQHLHERRIVFRDLKPQNIGFNQAGQLQLFDFGLCRELPIDDSTLDGQVYEMSGVGTRRYMAPEIVNESRYNTKADVYSWAMVVWQMFTMTKPYPLYSTNEHGILVCQQGERPPLTNVVPVVMQKVLLESWCDSVSDRLTMAEIHDRLANGQAANAYEKEPLVTEITITCEGIEVEPKEAVDSDCSSSSKSQFLYHMFEQEHLKVPYSPFKLPQFDKALNTDTTCTACTSDLSLASDEASLILSAPSRVPAVIALDLETAA